MDFPTSYQEFIYTRTYSRWKEKEKCRETWKETVNRYKDFFISRVPSEKEAEFNSAITSIINLDVMPSMRALWAAGPALDRENIAGYNCSYLAVNNIKSFAECLYILMNGTGVGFSVERQEVNKLPEVPQLKEVVDVVEFSDSKKGWADGFYRYLRHLYKGEIPKYDLSKIRPKGSILKTFGGRASGPEPLDDLIKFTTQLFKNAQGRKLSSIECHDIMCKVAAIVVVGGVRRCLPFDTPIMTNNGIKSMHSLEDTDKVLYAGKTYPIKGKVFSGKQKTLLFKTRFSELECTLNHRVAVFEKNTIDITYKQAKDVCVGDMLVWDTNGYEGSELIPLPEFTNSNHFNSKQLTFPAYINEDVAYLFGVIVGNGHISPKGIEITQHTLQKEVLTKCKNIAYEYFGIDSKVSQGHGDCLRLRLNSVSISQWMSHNLKNSSELYIPQYILNATKPVRSAFLAGLFDADGRGRADSVCEQVNTIYNQLKNDTVLALTSLGIGSRVDTIKREGYSDAYSIFVTGMTNKRKWIEHIKPFSVSGKADCITVSGGPFDYKIPSAWCGYPTGWKRDGFITMDTAIDRGFIKNTSLMPDMVVSIEDGRYVDTYDIEVDEINAFNANGYIVHNSACISLSNRSDDRMAHAKDGEFWNTNPQRMLANNSIVYTEKPDATQFMEDWLVLARSGSGERGIINRESMEFIVSQTGRRETGYPWGVNPCAEIILRPNSFCNLTEVVIRPEDTKQTLRQKVRYATVLGCLQSTLTDFGFLSRSWKNNTEDERLLGVSLTGLRDHPILGKVSKKAKAWLTEMKETAIETAEEWSKALHINMPAAITCTKPSGTVSQLVDSASGLHPRFSPYYVRRVRVSTGDPVFKYLNSIGMKWEPEVGQTREGCSTAVFPFPIKSPESAVMRQDVDALEQLEYWLMLQKYWCEHKPSITVYVKENEWLKVGSWVYEHWNYVSGISFLPYDGGVYPLAPYTECTEEEFIELSKNLPVMDFLQLSVFENEDKTEGSREFNCTGDKCEM